MFSNQKRIKTTLKLGVCVVCITALGFQGCQSTGGSSSDPPKVMGIFPQAPDRSGAEIWADTCMRCHNAPPPQRYSDDQWAVIVHHMRLRANLTGQEQRKITEFLQASN